MSGKRLIGITALCVAFAAAPAFAEGDGKAEAKRHFDNGVTMQELEDFDGAVVEYEASINLYRTQNALFNLGMCYKAIHKYQKALDAFRTILKEYGKAMSEDVKNEVSDNIQKINKMVAKLEVTTSAPGATVLVDGEQMGTTPLAAPIVLGAGEHRVRVSSQGYADQEKTVSLVAGQSQVVDFSLEAAAPAPAVVGALAPAPFAGPPPEQVAVEKATGENLSGDYARFKRTADSDRISYAQYRYDLAAKKSKQGLLTLAVGTPILVGAGLGLFFGIQAAKNDGPSYMLSAGQKAENRALNVLSFVFMGLFDAAAVVTLSVGAANMVKYKKKMNQIRPLLDGQGEDKAAEGEAKTPEQKEGGDEAQPPDAETAPETSEQSSGLSGARFIGFAPLFDRSGTPGGALVGFSF